MIQFEDRTIALVCDGRSTLPWKWLDGEPTANARPAVVFHDPLKLKAALNGWEATPFRCLF